jgi:mannose-6-phosphate isomerase-like protein (cupin superfamily)
LVEEAVLVRQDACPPPFEVSRFTVRHGTSSIPEAHEEAEIWLVAKGQGQVHCGDERVAVEPGSIVMFEPEKIHYVVNGGSEDMLIFAIYWIDAPTLR